MAVNEKRPHIFVLSEDEANRKILIGFVQGVDKNPRQIQALRFNRGKSDVLEDFIKVYVGKLRDYNKSFVVLLLDFDENVRFRDQILEHVPEEVRDQVFVIGAPDEPEHLRRVLGDFETIGQNLARDCRDNTQITWGHDLLKHNLEELARMPPDVRSILFD